MSPFLAGFASQATGMMVMAVGVWKKMILVIWWLNFLYLSIYVFFNPLSCQSAVAAGLLISFLPRRKSNNNPEFDVREQLENWGTGSPVYRGMGLSCNTTQRMLTVRIFLGFKKNLW